MLASTYKFLTRDELTANLREANTRLQLALSVYYDTSHDDEKRRADEMRAAIDSVSAAPLAALAQAWNEGWAAGADAGEVLDPKNPYQADPIEG